MSELVEIILQAVDNASSIFESVNSTASELGSNLTASAEEASSGFDEVDQSASQATGTIQDIIDYCQNMDGSGFNDAASGADSLEQEVNEADQAVQDLGSDLGIVNSSMLLQLADQVGAIGQKAEGMAQDMNTASISVGQLATQTGVAEPQMVSLINTISNATFPNDEAMMYVKSLDQMGVASENLGQSATHLDMINDAFGLGAQTVNSLGQELGVLGVDMNNVSSAFNALAYANANTVGGMENYYTFLRKYDSQFKELGFNVDQASVIIAAATQKFGGGRAALSGLSKALEESAGDSRKLEEALGMQAGSIDNATALTGQYEGQLAQLASEEAEHKTLLDQLGAAWEDLSLSLSGILSPLGSVIGMIGAVGQFGLQISGIQQLITTMRGAKTAMQEFSIAQTVLNAVEGEGAIARIASAIGITTEAAAAEGATVAFGGLAIAEGAALWPILAIIAAIALFVAAVYEIGKAFNWWDDVGTMIEAISDGLQRMWNAFVNHPDVQAIISAISTAWSMLTGAIGGAWNALMEFLGISTGGEFDIVRALIDGIGLAWALITEPIRTVIELVMMVIDVFSQLSTGQMDLQTVVLTAWNGIITFLSTVFSTIGLLASTLATNLFTWATQAGFNVLTGISTYLMQVPVRVATFLAQVLSQIISYGARWVAQGRQKASLLLNAIIAYLRQLPGRALSALLGVVSSIVSAGTQWVTNAKNKAKAVVDGVGNTLSNTASAVANALNGVKDAVVKPFQDAYNQAKQWWDKIANLGNNAAGFDFTWTPPSAAGFELSDVNVGAGNVSTSSSNVQKLEVEANLTHDFRNLPNGVTAEEVARIVQDSTTDDSFVKKLANNITFQREDSKVKAVLTAKNNRAKGI